MCIMRLIVAQLQKGLDGNNWRRGDEELYDRGDVPIAWHQPRYSNAVVAHWQIASGNDWRIWQIPSSEIEKRIKYKIVRHGPVALLNGPLSEQEVERITDDLAHVLRSLGASVRKDGLKKVVLGQAPVDALLWRFIHRALIAQSAPKDDEEHAIEGVSAAWAHFKAETGDHAWTGEKPGGPKAADAKPSITEQEDAEERPESPLAGSDGVTNSQTAARRESRRIRNDERPKGIILDPLPRLLVLERNCLTRTPLLNF